MRTVLPAPGCNSEHRCLRYDASPSDACRHRIGNELEWGRLVETQVTNLQRFSRIENGDEYAFVHKLAVDIHPGIALFLSALVMQ